MKFNREYKIGLIVLTSFVTLIWGVNFLKGRDIFSGGTTYYGIYKSVEGLTNNSPIYYKGFKIGGVRDIQIHDHEKIDFLVTFGINKDVQFPNNTLAQIYSLDLMGSKGVQFIAGDSKTFLKPEDTLRSAVIGDFVDQMSMQVLPLKEKTEKLIVKLDSSLTKLGNFFGDNNQGRFESIMKNLDVSMANFASITTSLNKDFGDSGRIHNSLNQFENLMISVGNKKDEISNMINNLEQFSDNLKEANVNSTLDGINQAMYQVDSLIAVINSGEGTLGMLMHDKELYYHLTDATTNLDRLLLDVKHNPKRYINISAFDLGKKVYVKDNGLGSDGIVFMVLIEESKSPLDLGGKKIDEELRIYEDFDGKKYLYTTGQVNNYIKAKEILEKVKITYPDASIVAYEHGESIRLKKALKKLE